MIIREVKVKGINFKFVCESWSNSKGWGHRVVLFENDREINEAKIKYYNRTWECYTYQSCMQKAVRELLDDRKLNVIDNYKYVKGISRLSQDKKDEIANADERVNIYRLLAEKLEGYQKAWI